MTAEKRWSEAETCKFVQKYIESDCLWDVGQPEYKIKSVRNNALDEIAKLMSPSRKMTISDVKNKIRSLRSTYFGEVQKMKRSHHESPDVNYRPGMKWFYLLKPIMDKIVQRREDTDSDNSLVIVDCNMKYEYPEDEHEYFEQAPSTSNDASEPTTSENFYEYETVPKKPKNDESNDVANETEVFSQYVKIQLQQLQEEKRLIVQNEILNMLNEARLRQVRETQQDE